MARVRILKPGFFKNEKLADLGPTAQLLFAGLWTLADREGRLEYRPRRIAADLFPFYDVDVTHELDALTDAGFVQRYSANGIDYIYLPTFLKHQKIHHTERASALPPPPVTVNGALDNRESSVNEPSISPCINGVNGVNGDSRIKTLSGILPDVSPPASENNDHGNSNGKSAANATCRATARGLLLFLNEKTGRHYQPVAVNLDMIVARLKEGATELQCRQVILRKSREWATNEHMAPYLRPATLFNRTKFWQYMGELVQQEGNA
jgi:uncharacterized phage protein (TIGR02220 family)